MIKLVLFDWGDVCGLYNLTIFNTFIKSLGHDSALVDEYFKEFKPQFDRSQISEKTFWHGLAQKLGFKGDWRVLAKNNKKNLKVNWPVLEFIAQLRKTNKVALLSNMDTTSVDAIKQEVKLEKYFDKLYFSFEHKMGKLEKPLIDKVLTDFNVKPEEVLFVDDFPGNVEKAKLLGMNTLLFTGLSDLKRHLKLS